jgi:hypothetical protein
MAASSADVLTRQDLLQLGCDLLGQLAALGCGLEGCCAHTTEVGCGLALVLGKQGLSLLGALLALLVGPQIARALGLVSAYSALSTPARAQSRLRLLRYPCG